MANDFDMTLHQIHVQDRERDVVPNDEESKLLVLKECIEQEKIATFWYLRKLTKVVPSAILLDNEGLMTLRAFQLVPNQTWRTFKFAWIEMLLRGR